MPNNLLQINMGDSHGGAQQVGLDLHYGLRPKWNTTLLVGQKRSTDSTIQQLSSPKLFTYANLLLGLEYMCYPNTFWLQHRAAFHQADIVQYHNLHGYYFNLLAFPHLTKLKPSVWSFHDMWPMLGHPAYSFDCPLCEAGVSCPEHKSLYPKLYTWNSAALLYRVKKHILQHSQFQLVVSSRWLEKKLANSFLRDKPAQLIYNGIDTTIFTVKNKSTVRQQLGLPLDKKIVLFLAVGGLNDPRKGGNYLKQLLERFATDDTILFVSIGGNNEATLNLPNLKQFGHITDQHLLADYYNAADVFVSPAIAENISLTVLGSLACGVPVLVFNVGGMPEVVKHQHNGYLAKLDSIVDLENGLNYLLTKTNPLAMATAARTTIEPRFNLTTMLAAYHKLYTSLLN